MDAREKLQVVSVAELLQLRRFCRWWAAGWVAAGLALLVAGAASGVALAERRARRETAEIAQMQRETIEQLKANTGQLEDTRERFAETFARQNTLAQILTDWSEYMVSRYDTGKKNVSMRPFNFEWEKQHAAAGPVKLLKNVSEE